MHCLHAARKVLQRALPRRCGDDPPRVDDLLERGKGSSGLPVFTIIWVGILILGGYWVWKHPAELLFIYHQYVHADPH